MAEDELSNSTGFALVTGGGTGIGRAIALKLAAEGRRLALFGRRLEPLEAVAKEAKVPCVCYSLDVSDQEAVDVAFAKAVTEFGPPDVLVANAGIGGPDIQNQEDRFDAIVRTNLYGAYFCSRSFVRYSSTARGPRNIIVISSCVARFGVAGIAGYSAAKAGQLGLVRSLAVELAPVQVRVNAICPGWVDTELAHERMSEIAASQDRTYQDIRKDLLEGVPLQRITQPDEIASLIVYLISSDGASFTGQVFDPNDGQWMG